jgi:hypothetical protein
VKDGDVYTLYKAADKPEAVKDCEDLYSVGYMREGLIPVAKNGKRISVVDGNGKVQFTLNPIDGEEIVSCASCYSDGMLSITTDLSGSGYVDTKGNVVIKPSHKYYVALPFSEGKAVVDTETETEQKYYVINKKGEVLYRFHDDYTLCGDCYSYGMLAVKDGNDRILFLNEKGEVKYKCSSKVDAVGDYNSKYFTYKTKDDEWGVMDYNGEVVVRAKYEDVRLVDEDKFLCIRKGKSTIVNKSGDEKYVVEDFKKVFYSSGFFVGIDENSCSLLDKELKPVKNAEFADVAYANSVGVTVESNYVNIDEIMNAVSGLINSKGVDKYAIGSNPSEYLSDPEAYFGSGSGTYIQLKELEKSGFRYTINCRASYDDYMSYRLVQDQTYHWNTNAGLREVEIEVLIYTKWDSSYISNLINAIQAKGYQKIVDDSYKGGRVSSLENDKVRIDIKKEEYSSYFTVTVRKPDVD